MSYAISDLAPTQYPKSRLKPVLQLPTLAFNPNAPWHNQSPLNRYRTHLMNDKPLVVYPDADGDEETLYPALFQRLRETVELRVHCGRPATEAEYVERIRDARGILLGWDLPADVMQHASDLEVISFTGVGASRFIDMSQAGRRNITVCNCPSYSDITVAEHTMALLLSLCRHIPALNSAIRTGSWQNQSQAVELHGKHIGLIGFGGIGKRFSQLCKAFGMQVSVWTRSMNKAYEADYGVAICSLEALYANCDVISLHLAANRETQGLVDQRAFDAMRDGTLLINTARAELIDEQALLDALQSGRLAGAGLDVFHEEPLAASHPLCSLPNVVMTPHTGFNTPESVARLYQIGIDNLIGYFNGKATNVIDE